MFFNPIKANAKNFDYTDYIIEDSYIDGQNHLKIRIPIEDFSTSVWRVYFYETGVLESTQYGSRVIYDIVGERPLRFSFNAFEGNANSAYDNLLITDIPNGSTLSLHYEIVDLNDDAYTTMSVKWELQYFDVNFNFIDVQTIQDIGDFKANTFDIDIQKPDKAVWMRAKIDWFPVSTYTGMEIELVAEAFEFDVSIDAMQREQQLTGRTNKLLEKVNESLNTTVPGASDSINNSNNAQDKLEAAGDALANVPKPPLNDVDVSVNNYIPSGTSEQINDFYGALWENELFMTMLLLLLTIGTCSYVLFGKR